MTTVAVTAAVPFKACECIGAVGERSQAIAGNYWDTPLRNNGFGRGLACYFVDGGVKRPVDCIGIRFHASGTRYQGTPEISQKLF